MPNIVMLHQYKPLAANSALKSWPIASTTTLTSGLPPLLPSPVTRSRTFSAPVLPSGISSNASPAASLVLPFTTSLPLALSTLPEGERGVMGVLSSRSFQRDRYAPGPGSDDGPDDTILGVCVPFSLGAGDDERLDARELAEEETIFAIVGFFDGGVLRTISSRLCDDVCISCMYLICWSSIGRILFCCSEESLEKRLSKGSVKSPASWIFASERSVFRRKCEAACFAQSRYHPVISLPFLQT